MEELKEGETPGINLKEKIMMNEMNQMKEEIRLLKKSLEAMEEKYDIDIIVQE